MGATDLREEHLAARFRVYVECDPVIAELQLANGDHHTAVALANHHAIVTYGENFGSPDCGVPLNGHRYGKTRQPVDLDLWPMVYEPESRFFTTIRQLPPDRQRRRVQRRNLSLEQAPRVGEISRSAAAHAANRLSSA